jgi:ubiquinone/menaquinone biosynthesis C-methylase UbiE
LRPLPFGDETIDCVISSLFFHHLNRDSKTASLKEIFRVLRKNGRVVVADWVMPSSRLMRVLFYQIQFLDGFENTEDHVAGKFPTLMENAGFIDCTVTDDLSTVFGSISVFEAAKQ